MDHDSPKLSVGAQGVCHTDGSCNSTRKGRDQTKMCVGTAMGPAKQLSV